MSITKYKELQHFLSTYFSESDNDEDGIQSFLTSNNSDKQLQVIQQAKQYLKQCESIVEELGMEANRWFESSEDAQTWLNKIIYQIEKSQTKSGSTEIVVKDSNGAVLAEGDSVSVIKDLKVKGGSSDLKRGTTIKNIHLIDDPDNIECRVDGSTLVLKTIFLKKV